MRNLLLCSVLIAGCSAELPAGSSVTQNPTLAAPQTGPQGPAGLDGTDGRDGVSVEVQTIAPGDARCPFGGTRFVGASTEAYACNADPLSTAIGDGADGPRQVVHFEAWPDATALRLESLVVEADQTLVVPSGSTLRVRGDVEIRGTVQVQPGVPGPALLRRPPPGSMLSIQAIAGSGIAAGPAMPGDLGDASYVRVGGPAGVSSLDLGAARGLTHGLRFGGGAGASSFDGPGCAGGGALRIVSGGAITVAAGGVLSADAPDCRAGAGGGGGGLVVLSARNRVQVDGRIGARGGAGGSSTSYSGAGGGGGGGIIHLIAPVVDAAGELDIAGGEAGPLADALVSTLRSGGGGGGASGGDGGQGGAVSMGTPPSSGTSTSGGTSIATEPPGTPLPAQAGAPGHKLVSNEAARL